MSEPNEEITVPDQLITEELVVLDEDLGPAKEDVIRALADAVARTARASESDSLFTDAWAREQQSATGIPGGIAIPHARSRSVVEPTLAMARLKPAVSFGAKDGPADLVFLIAAPEGADQAHLKLLSALARALMRPAFREQLRAAHNAKGVVSLVQDAIYPVSPQQAVVATEPETSEEPASSGNAEIPMEPDPSKPPQSLVAVTACATGIAHTYMAADALSAAAQELGVPFAVETQGSAGAKPLSSQLIDDAAAVIFAVDVDVRGKERFAGKPVVNVPVKAGIEEPKALIQRALAAAQDPQTAAVIGTPGTNGAAGNGTNRGNSAEPERASLGQSIKRVLLTGVSYMIPFVAAGGLLMALGFLLGTYQIAGQGVADDALLHHSLWNLPDGHFGRSGFLIYLGAVAFKIGNLSMSFLVPALAGYIAFGIADRTGIAPGFTAGAVALFMGAGFLGGLIGGVLAGLVAYWLTSLEVPRWLRGLMPVVIIPLIASLIASGLMLLVLGAPIAWLMNLLNQWLSGMSGTSAIVVGMILGVMMCIDLGGPINKVAYSFAVAGLGAASLSNPGPWTVMAAVMGAGMVPPLGMALATMIGRKLFTAPERENGKAAILLGASFISEGAIPFAAVDPMRVIPASVLGGALTGGLSMAFGVTSQAPHGGFFVSFAISPLLAWIFSILCGTVLTALVVLALKRRAAKTRAKIRNNVDSDHPENFPTEPAGAASASPTRLAPQSDAR